MLSPGERKIRWLFGGLGFGCFALLLALEMMTERDQIALADILMDALTLALTIGAAVGVGLLTQRLHAQHEEKSRSFTTWKSRASKAMAGGPRFDPTWRG